MHLLQGDKEVTQQLRAQPHAASACTRQGDPSPAQLVAERELSVDVDNAVLPKPADKAPARAARQTAALTQKPAASAAAPNTLLQTLSALR